MTLTGPDVSRHQGDVDMHAVRDDGHDFVGIKVDEGSTWRDPLFRQNRDRARTAGLIRLLYHFARPSSGANSTADALAEARWFVQCIGQLEPGEIVVLDQEDDKAKGDLTDWTLTWLAEVDRLTGRAGGSPEDDAALYSYGPYARAHLRLRPADLAKRALWLAAYSNSPTVPAPWRSWTFWQHTSSGSCPGITGRCDLNRFSGPLAALQAMAGLQPVHAEQIPVNVSTAHQEDPLMPAAKSDDDARRALVRQWFHDYLGRGFRPGQFPDGTKFTATEEQGLHVWSFAINGADLTLAGILDSPEAQARA